MDSLPLYSSIQSTNAIPVSAVLEKNIEDIFALKDCTFFTHVLTYLDEGFKEKLRNDCPRTEIFNHVKLFLEEYYNNTEDILNFDLAVSAKEDEEELVKLELTKIAVALICVGILDKKGQVFVDAALELQADIQEDILAIFKSVLAPDTGEMMLTKDLESVLMRTAVNRSETPVGILLQESNSKTEEMSSCEQNSRNHTPHSRQSRRSANSSLLNTSLGDLTSPFKSLDITASSSSSFVEFIQSPQFVQKAVLKQRDIELRRVRQQLNAEIILKEEYRLNAEELLVANKQKDAEIENLQQRVSELLSEKSSEISMGEMAAKLQEAESEAAMLRDRVSGLLQWKLQCEALEAEHKSLDEDYRKLQKEVSLLRVEKQVKGNSLMSVEHLTNQLQLKSGQIDELTATVDALRQDKALLTLDLEVVRERLVAVRQNVAELESKLDEKTAVEGETMSIVLDIQMKELKKQMEELREERDALLQQVIRSNAESNSATCGACEGDNSENPASNLTHQTVVEINGNYLQKVSDISSDKLDFLKDDQVLNSLNEHSDSVCLEPLLSPTSEFSDDSGLSSARTSVVFERQTSCESPAQGFGKRPFRRMEFSKAECDAFEESLNRQEFQLFTDVVLGTAERCVNRAKCDQQSPVFHIPKELFFQLWLSNREKDALIRDLNMRIGCLYLQLRQKGGESKKFSTDLMIVSRFFKKHGYTLDTIVKSKQKIFHLMGSVSVLQAKLLRVQKLLSEKTQQVNTYRRLAQGGLTSVCNIKWPVSENGAKCFLAPTGAGIAFDAERVVEGAESVPVATVKKDGKEILVAVASALPEKTEGSLSVSSCTLGDHVSEMDTSQENATGVHVSEKSQCGLQTDKVEGVKEVTADGSQSEERQENLQLVKAEPCYQLGGEDLIKNKFDSGPSENGHDLKNLSTNHRPVVSDKTWSKKRVEKENLDFFQLLTNGSLYDRDGSTPSVNGPKRIILEEPHAKMPAQGKQSLNLSERVQTNASPQGAPNSSVPLGKSSSVNIGFVGSISTKLGHPLSMPQLEKRKAEVAAKEEQVSHKTALWEKARAANATLSQTLTLERDTVVKMKSRMEAYIKRCGDLNVKLEALTAKNQAKESEVDSLRSELKETQEMLEACREGLAQARSRPDLVQKASLGDSTFDCSLSMSNLLPTSEVSNRNPETSQMLMRMTSAPVLPRQTNISTTSLQSVKSLMDHHPALLPNAMSCAAEPDSPVSEWNTLSRLTGRSIIKTDCDDKKFKRKGLSALPENCAEMKSVESPAKQRKTYGGTTVFFPLDPNGPVYPPADSNDQFRLTSRQMVSPPHRSDLKMREGLSSSTSTSSLVLALTDDPSPTSNRRPQNVKVSKYTPAKRAGRRFHVRQETKSTFLNQK
ncbi:hypothetical protein EGW08_012555 [Elysia chlorotica]|uniref:Uncharacterized protein n=1 Tax=Elysia chlorotica TaxID=188477 RepID=A0A433TDI2_ELYCH|nr:hypothetical protein EGW08_012555 [Elysia chlorotica]